MVWKQSLQSIKGMPEEASLTPCLLAAFGSGGNRDHTGECRQGEPSAEEGAEEPLGEGGFDVKPFQVSRLPVP